MTELFTAPEPIAEKPRQRVPMAQGRPDDFQTPPKALGPLLPFLPKDAVIWECACGKGNLARALEEHGFRVVATDIKTGHDFLHYQPERWDIIVTNPPFSIKTEFLAHAYRLGHPFALLMPLTALCSKRRQEMYARYGLEVVMLDWRVDFETPTGKGSSSQFDTAWFTHGLNIGRQLVFQNPSQGQEALAL